MSVSENSTAAHDSEYAAAHRAERQEYMYHYWRNLPDIVAEKKRRHALQWEAIKVAYGHKCAYCGKRTKKLTIDHVIAIANGGHDAANNVVPACGSCNSAKSVNEPPRLPALRLMV